MHEFKVRFRTRDCLGPGSLNLGATESEVAALLLGGLEVAEREYKTNTQKTKGSFISRIS